jgi:glycosyltransferase involved in cell wall biosynthesis
MSDGVLFVHSNFPAQFRDLASALVERGTPCWSIGATAAPGLDGVPIKRWSNAKGSTPGIFPLATRAEADLIRGHAALAAARALKDEGVDPAVIIGHPGWGETVLLHEAFPRARRVLFHELFYQGRGGDIDFDVEFIPPTEAMILGGIAKNAVMALALTQADVIVSPTPYQAGTLPAAFHSRLRLIHEGVDVAAIRPGPPQPLTLPDGATLDPRHPVITHVNRHLEPMRGLHILLRALPRLQAAAPDVQTVIVGSPDVRGYSGAAPDGRTWKDMAMAGLEGRIDLSRVHFTGRLPHDQMLAALRASWAHVYYTYPFVLSWSLAEAMASGCYVIGSDTPPVRDAIEDGVNGKLLDFFDVEGLSLALIDACRRPEAFAAQRLAARRTAEARFDRAAGRGAWLALVDEMLGR